MKEFLKIFNLIPFQTSIKCLNPQKAYWRDLLQRYINKSAILVDYTKKESVLIKIKEVYNDYIVIEKAEYHKTGKLRNIINSTVHYSDFICNNVKLVILNE